jgi:hypothetical protein
VRIEVVSWDSSSSFGGLFRIATRLFFAEEPWAAIRAPARRCRPRPGVSVAEVACNAEFCRAEVLGSAQADVIQDANTLMMSVAAKNLKCLNAKDETSTTMGCYFGWDGSWTGLRPEELQR